MNKLPDEFVERFKARKPIADDWWWIQKLSKMRHRRIAAKVAIAERNA